MIGKVGKVRGAIDSMKEGVLIIRVVMVEVVGKASCILLNGEIRGIPSEVRNRARCPLLSASI